VRERECVKKRENGFKDSQENSHVQEPTAASFNQILPLGDYSSISLSSLFTCHISPHSVSGQTFSCRIHFKKGEYHV